MGVIDKIHMLKRILSEAEKITTWQQDIYTALHNIDAGWIVSGTIAWARLVANFPRTIAELLSDHNKAVHDALNIDADTVDGDHKADLEATMDTRIATHKDDASAHHAKTTSSEIDHGLVQGLADDDHTQYLNAARHDVVARHPLSVLDPDVCSEAEADAKIAAKVKSGTVTDTTGADGKISVNFSVPFTATPVVCVQIEGDVDYYPVITARNQNGFTAKILKTAHAHSQANTGAVGGHTHNNPATLGPSNYWDLMVQGSQYPDQKYCAAVSGGSPTTPFWALQSIAGRACATGTHTHSQSPTLSAGGHSHTNPDTNQANAGNTLASTQVTLSYIAVGA